MLLIEMFKMLLLIERSKCWRCCWSKFLRFCCWSKDQSAKDVADQNAEDIVADRKVKMLKMLLIERSKCWRCCCWLKGLSAEDVAVRKVKVLKMLLIKRSKYVDADQRVVVIENWRQILYDVEKLPMIYRCVTLMMLMISSPTIFFVVVEYPCH